MPCDSEVSSSCLLCFFKTSKSSETARDVLRWSSMSRGELVSEPERVKLCDCRPDTVDCTSPVALFAPSILFRESVLSTSEKSYSKSLNVVCECDAEFLNRC